MYKINYTTKGIDFQTTLQDMQLLTPTLAMPPLNPLNQDMYIV